MNEAATVTRLQALKLYWSNFWRAALVMFGGAVVVAPIYGIIAGLLMPGPSLTEMILRLALVLVALVLVSGWAARSALRVRYSDFIIKPSTPEFAASEALITLWLGVRFWWSYAWRSLLIAVPFSVVVQLALHGTLAAVPASRWQQVFISDSRGPSTSAPRCGRFASR